MKVTLLLSLATYPSRQSGFTAWYYLNHGSKSWSRPPTQCPPFHIDRGVSEWTWAIRAKRYK